MRVLMCAGCCAHPLLPIFQVESPQVAGWVHNFLQCYLQMPEG